MKTSAANNEYLTPQFSGDNDSISIKSTAHILCLNLA